jgi:GDP-mannose 6-dehydrogenase
MLASILDSNDAHLDLAFDKVMAASAATGSRKVGFVGLSFKTGTDDLRESPLVTLAERLIGKGCDLAIYDPEVHLARLLGANKNFIAQHLPHIGQMLKAELHEVVAASDVIVLGSSSKLVTEALAALLRPGQRVIDLVGLSAGQTLPVPVQGLSW